MTAGSERPGAGRPTREQAERRHAELLDKALEMFLGLGFEQTTIDAIAAAVGMTKRTVYARHADKRALFRAAVSRAIDRSAVPLAAMRDAETVDLEETLIAIARLRTDTMLSPAGLRLQRVINAEAHHFPEIAQLYFERGTAPPLAFLADLFARRGPMAGFAVDHPAWLAAAFLSLVVGSQTRRAVLGDTGDDPDRDARIRFGVRLFLDGFRPR